MFIPMQCTSTGEESSYCAYTTIFCWQLLISIQHSQVYECTAGWVLALSVPPSFPTYEPHCTPFSSISPFYHPPVFVFLTFQSLLAPYWLPFRTVADSFFSSTSLWMVYIIPHSFQFHTILSLIFSDIYHTLSITDLLHSLLCTFILALYLDWE